MDSDDDTFDNVDSGNVSSGEDDFPIVDEVEMSCSKDRQSEHDEYPYEGLTTEEIVQHMVDCIKEVNTVVEVSSPVHDDDDDDDYLETISCVFQIWFCEKHLLSIPWIPSERCVCEMEDDFSVTEVNSISLGDGDNFLTFLLRAKFYERLSLALQ